MTQPLSSANPAPRRLALPEFTAMLASLTATVAFSIDAMLPALPEIAAQLSPGDVNRAQLVLTAFVLGMGIGTFIVGPVSDAFGRKRTITAGILIYMIGAFLATQADSLETLLFARALQGLGAAAPRIVPMALVRDLYSGREMARVTSIIMMIFILVPAVAPSVGAVIIGLSDWRGVFWAFIAFGTVGMSWVNLRQPETLSPDRRRPLRIGTLVAGVREVLAEREVRLYTLILTLGFGQMFALLSSSQQLFTAYGASAGAFPKWFALMALLAGSGSVLNAKFVVHLGMRRIATAAYLMQVICSAVMLALVLLGLPMGGAGFAAVFLWSVTVFFMAGVTFGNLNALAMQKMGHLAGMTASVVTALSTVGAVLIAAPVGLMFNGSALPIVCATLICSALAWALMRRTVDLG